MWEEKSNKNCVCEEDYIWNLNTCAWKIDKYLKSLIDNSVVTCDKIVDTVFDTYKKLTNFNEKRK